MNNEEYNKLKESGMIMVLKHYMMKLHSKEITKEVYAKAIAFWAQEFKNKDKQQSIVSNGSVESVVDTPQAPEDKQESIEVHESTQETVVDKLIKDFGARGITIKDTGVDIKNEKKNTKK
jgi:hypothetical protein